MKKLPSAWIMMTAHTYFFPCMHSYPITENQTPGSWLEERRSHGSSAMRLWRAKPTASTYLLLITGNNWDIDRFLLFLLLTSCLRVDIASTLMTSGDISIYNYTFKLCNYFIQNNCFKMLFECNYLEGNPSLPDV